MKFLPAVDQFGCAERSWILQRNGRESLQCCEESVRRPLSTPGWMILQNWLRNRCPSRIQKTRSSCWKYVARPERVPKLNPVSVETTTLTTTDFYVKLFYFNLNFKKLQRLKFKVWYVRAGDCWEPINMNQTNEKRVRSPARERNSCRQWAVEQCVELISS